MHKPSTNQIITLRSAINDSLSRYYSKFGEVPMSGGHRSADDLDTHIQGLLNELIKHRMDVQQYVTPEEGSG